NRLDQNIYLGHKQNIISLTCSFALIKKLLYTGFYFFFGNRANRKIAQAPFFAYNIGGRNTHRWSIFIHNSALINYRWIIDAIFIHEGLYYRNSLLIY